MVRNYILITLRNLLRNRSYTFINIVGLSIGLTACIVIFLLIRYDLSFDSFHSKGDRIFKVVEVSRNSSGTSYGSTTPYPFIAAFRNDFPQVPLNTQMHFEEDMMLKAGEEKFVVENVLFVDSLFFELFDFQVIEGNPKVALGEPGNVFLTESLARKRGLSPGESIRLDNRVDAKVAGIVMDPPATSHIQFSLVVSMPSLTSDFISGLPLDQWTMTASGHSYIYLPEGIAPEKFEEDLVGFVKKYFAPEDSERKKYLLLALPKIHFDEEFTENPGNVTNASYRDIVVLSLLGLFILIIACINFINLSTALAVRKSKEVGIRKTLGARRDQLATYFFAETFLITLVAILISLGVTEWLTPWVNNFVEKKVSLQIVSDSGLIWFIVLLILFTTVFSGFYPAVVLSRYNPVHVLKNKISTPSKGLTIRKALVICQFLIAQMLIIGTLIVAAQMEYFRTKPLGFDKDAVIMLKIPENKSEALVSLRSRLESIPEVRSVSFGLGSPTSDNNFGTNFFLTENGSEQRYGIGVKPVDRHYLETFGLTLVAGRWFTESDERLADRAIPREEQKYVYVLNESAVRKLGFDQPEGILGKFVTTGVNSINAEVVGVVSDFHVASLHAAINPVVLMNFPYFYLEAGVKVTPSRLPETIEAIRKHWSDLYPDYYFEYSFLDENLAKLYRKDERTFTLIRIFAGVSIFIGCLGLYGLVSFMANQKVKEVGIRKVMGASVASIVVLFSKDFVVLILIAFGLAAPVAWYIMQEWLSSFAYHISIHWSVFAISLLATVVIALSTVFYRSISAAFTNPAETLRTE